jgi:hypothetical protein
VPQAPQLFGSVETSVHPLLHAAHVPPAYVAQLEQSTPPSAEGGEAQPLAPELWLHEATQTPAAHVSLPLHACRRPRNCSSPSAGPRRTR